MTTTRLEFFPTKNSPTGNDLVYLANSSDSFNEINATIDEVVNGSIIPLKVLENLSDLNNAATARMNLGIINPIDAITDTVSMAVNTSYTVNNANLVAFTLPPVSAVGDVVEIIGNTMNGWSLDWTTGQSAIVGDVIGLPDTGSITYTNQYDSLSLKCVVASSLWVAQSVVGNLSVVIS